MAEYITIEQATSRLEELRARYGSHPNFPKLEGAVAHIIDNLKEGTKTFGYYTETVFGHFEISVGNTTPECMCCGEEIKLASPDEELCLDCYEDVVVPEEEIIEWELEYDWYAEEE